MLSHSLLQKGVANGDPSKIFFKKWSPLNIAYSEIFTHILAANPEPTVFSIKTWLASHLLQIKAAATTTRLADKASYSQPTFLISQLSIVGWGGSGH